MAKTVVGLFDNRAAAQSAVQDLLAAGFTRDDISVMSKRAGDEDGRVEYVEEDGHDQVEDMAKGAGTGAAIGGAAGLLLSLTAFAIPGIGPVLAAGPLAAIIAGAGIGATAGGTISGLTRLGLNESDANTYAEGVRRGGTLVTVNSPDEKGDHTVAVMKRHDAVEIDKRAAQWRDEGWTGFGDDAATTASYEAPPATARRAAAGEMTAEHERLPAPAARGAQNDFTVPPRDEFAFPVVEEELRVGKREVDRGGVRVERRVTERPVEEDVQLREEHVNVERRPADYTFHGTEMEAFKEAQIEIREAYEELIVNKKARVVEEVVIGKDVEEHTETVRETLRRTDVDVHRLGPGRARGAAASSQDETTTRGGAGRHAGGDDEV